MGCGDADLRTDRRRRGGCLHRVSTVDYCTGLRTLPPIRDLAQGAETGVSRHAREAYRRSDPLGSGSRFSARGCALVAEELAAEHSHVARPADRLRRRPADVRTAIARWTSDRHEAVAEAVSLTREITVSLSSSAEPTPWMLWWPSPDPARSFIKPVAGTGAASICIHRFRHEVCSRFRRGCTLSRCRLCARQRWMRSRLTAWPGPGRAEPEHLHRELRRQPDLSASSP